MFKLTYELALAFHQCLPNHVRLLSVQKACIVSLYIYVFIYLALPSTAHWHMLMMIPSNGAHVMSPTPCFKIQGPKQKEEDT
jgi:hypothetical protein